MSKLLHYYHVYCDGRRNWLHCVEEHCVALRTSGLENALEGPVIVGVVGDRDQRSAVRSKFRECGVNAWISSSVYTTWEQRTLQALWLRAQQNADGLVLYAHTKGAANPSVRQDKWREDMTRLLVKNWEDCVHLLEHEPIDVVGAYRIVNDGVAKAAFGGGADEVAAFLNKETGSDIEVGPVFPEQGKAILAGNYFWSTMKWVRSLDRPLNRSRYDAEQWIGNENSEGITPTLYNLEPWRVE